MGQCGCVPSKGKPPPPASESGSFQDAVEQPPLTPVKEVSPSRQDTQISSRPMSRKLSVEELRAEIDRADGNLEMVAQLNVAVEDLDFFTADEKTEQGDCSDYDSDELAQPGPRSPSVNEHEEDIQQFRDNVVVDWVGPEDGPLPGATNVNTVPRCPLADMPEASFCMASSDVFNLRVGPDYNIHGGKEPSSPALYAPIGLDMYHSASPVYHVASKLKLPKLPYETNSKSAPAVFVINIQVPISQPSFVYKDLAGETINLVMQWVIKKETAEKFSNRDDLPPCLALLEEWCVRAFEDEQFRGRFKIMGKVPTANVPMGLSQFNGKPTLVTGSGKVFRGDGYIEVDCNIANWCYPARVSLYTLWATIKHQRGNFGCTIESRENMYMPENILGCFQFSQIDPNHAPEWPFALD